MTERWEALRASRVDIGQPVYAWPQSIALPLFKVRRLPCPLLKDLLATGLFRAVSKREA